MAKQGYTDFLLKMTSTPRFLDELLTNDEQGSKSKDQKREGACIADG
jgi:hypothetical protein